MSTPRTQLPKPKFRLQIHDLRHPASQYFLTLIPDLTSTLESALNAIIQNLYTPGPTSSRVSFSSKHKSRSFTPCIPPTRSVTILLRDIDGVAYTTGTELDNDHKEIHLSLPYIHSCRTKPDPLAELVGVLTHELVHCYQYAAPAKNIERDGDGDGDDDVPQAPGGLIEGVADFVRLRAGLEPPHWTRPSSAKERAEKWDQGYQHTAYFLAWLEDVWAGRGAVGMLNDRLARVGYVGEGEGEENSSSSSSSSSSKKKERFWKGLFGMGVEELWDEYGRYLDGKN